MRCTAARGAGFCSASPAPTTHVNRAVVVHAVHKRLLGLAVSEQAGDGLRVRVRGGAVQMDGWWVRTKGAIEGSKQTTFHRAITAAKGCTSSRGQHTLQSPTPTRVRPRNQAALAVNNKARTCRLYTGLKNSSSTTIRRQLTRLMPWVPALLIRNTWQRGAGGGKRSQLPTVVLFARNRRRASFKHVLC